MIKITLFVGDCDSSVADAALKFDSTSTLIDYTNYEEFLKNTKNFTGYTSLADLPNDLAILYNVFEYADSIVYCPPVNWSDNKSIDSNDVSSSIQGLTEFLLYHVDKNKHNVSGLDLNKFNSVDFLRLADYRKSDGTNLWIVGCSTTAGVGVDDSERYGYLLSQRLKLPVSFLAEDGSSLSWAADQILRSDIRENDFVIWGLTSENRSTLWHEKNHHTAHTNLNCFNNSAKQLGLLPSTIKELLMHKTNFVIALQQINQVVNFCRKVKAKLVILNIHSSNEFSLYLNNVGEFCPFLTPAGGYLDQGSDLLHPGPKQHQAYADFCYAALEKFKYV